MTIFFCPYCNTRIIVGFDVTDFIHDCSQSDKSDAIKFEDVVVTGNWEDFDGTGTIHPQAVLLQGLHNELFGTRAWVEGENREALTRRGKRVSTHRQRRHLQFIDLKNAKKR